MHPLPNPPATFRDIVEADLRRGARLIIKIQDELDPQVRIATPEGDYHIAMTLPADDYGRRILLRALATFLDWKRAIAFTLCSELTEPEALYCAGISPTHHVGCLTRISRAPRPWTAANFGAVEWLDPAQLDPFLIGLLPTEPRPLTPKDVAACNTWFGKDGKFPAIHIPTGEVRGV